MEEREQEQKVLLWVFARNKAKAICWLSVHWQFVLVDFALYDYMVSRMDPWIYMDLRM